MRDYGRVAPTFWTRGSGKKLRGKPQAQVVALYLFTCPASSMIGIYHLALPTMAHEMGMPLDVAERALAEVCAVGIAQYDPEEELVYLPEGARYQIGEQLKPGDKRVAGVKAALAQFARHPFAVDFARRYAADFYLPTPEDDAPPSTPSKPYAPPQEGASKGLGSGSEPEAMPLGSQIRQGKAQEQARTGTDPPNPPQAGGPVVVGFQPSEPAPAPAPPPETPKVRRKRPEALALPGVGAEPADDVFGAYVTAWRRAVGKGAEPVLGSARRKLVNARLAEGHTLDRLKAAAAGIFDSDWHVTEGRTAFDLALRDAGQVEKFAALFDAAESARAPRPVSAPSWLNQRPPLRPQIRASILDGLAREREHERRGAPLEPGDDPLAEMIAAAQGADRRAEEADA